MIRRPPRSTRTDTLFPYTTLFRSLDRRQIVTRHAGVAGAFAVADEYGPHGVRRSEEHTSELQSLMRISYAVFCLKKKNTSVYMIEVKRYIRIYIKHTPKYHNSETTALIRIYVHQSSLPNLLS